MSFGMHTCYRCKNFIEKAELGSGEFGNCKAFPQGIPYEVFACMSRWEKPENCNNGIGFEPGEVTDKKEK